MSNASVLAALLAVAGYAAARASATTFTVGDDQGWMTGVDYTTWASGKWFAVGDKLVFNYPRQEHTVTEVRKGDYFACAGGGALSSDDSGSTNVTLTASGTRYFICNVTVHCSIGMKLVVPVAGSPSSVSSGSAAPTGAAAVALAPGMGSVAAAAAAGALISKLALF